MAPLTSGYLSRPAKRSLPVTLTMENEPPRNNTSRATKILCTCSSLMLLYRGYTVHSCFCNSTIRFTCWNLILVFKYHYVLQLLGITQRNSSNSWEGNVIEQFNCASDLWHPLRIQKCINYLLFIHIPLRLIYNNTHSHLT